MRTPTLSAADEEVFGNRRCFTSPLLPSRTKTLRWTFNKKERGERVHPAVVSAHRKLHKVTLKVEPAGHCCGSLRGLKCAVWRVWRGHGSFLQLWVYVSFRKTLLSLKARGLLFSLIVSLRETEICYKSSRKCGYGTTKALTTARGALRVSMLAATAR